MWLRVCRTTFSVSYKYFISCFESMTDVKTVLVEEQRRSALNLLTLESSELGCRYCSHCQLYTRATQLPIYLDASKFMKRQLDLQKAGPHVPCQSLRSILSEACKGDNWVIHTCQGSLGLAVTGSSLKVVCNKVSNVACGLCLVCLQDDESDADTCAHHALLQKWTENDPIS